MKWIAPGTPSLDNWVAVEDEVCRWGVMGESKREGSTTREILENS